MSDQSKGTELSEVDPTVVIEHLGDILNYLARDPNISSHIFTRHNITLNNAVKLIGTRTSDPALSQALARNKELEEKIAVMERNSDYLSSLIPKAGQSKAGKALIRR